MKVLTRFRFAAAAVGVLLFTGCSSITNSHLQKEPLMAEYLAGKDARVELRLSEKLKSALNTGDELMWRLEAGAFFFNIGDRTFGSSRFFRFGFRGIRHIFRIVRENIFRHFITVVFLLIPVKAKQMLEASGVFGIFFRHCFHPFFFV